MADTPDLAADIAAQALEPASSASDGQSASARPVLDLIAADQHLAAKRAARRPLRGLAVTQLLGTPPLDAGRGAAGDFTRPGGY